MADVPPPYTETAAVETDAEVNAEVTEVTEPKKTRKPITRKTVQVNGVQYMVPKSDDKALADYLRAFDVLERAINLAATTDNKLDVLYVHFPWWLRGSEELMERFRQLNVQEAVPNGLVMVWAPAGFVGQTVRLLEVWGVHPRNVSKQMTIDYSSQYCSVSEDGASVTQTDYAHRPASTSDDEAREAIIQSIMKIMKPGEEERKVLRVPFPTSSRNRSVARQTTEDLYVGVLGEPSARIFANTPQRRIPYQNWVLVPSGSSAHPAVVQDQVEKSFSAKAKVLSVFSNTHLEGSTFQFISPHEPGLYYSPASSQHRVIMDLVASIYDALSQLKLRASECTKICTCVGKLTRSGVSDKTKTAAMESLLKVLLKGETEDASIFSFCDTLINKAELFTFLGAGSQDWEPTEFLQAINFYPALACAAGRLLQTKTSSSSAERKAKRKEREKSDKPLAPRGFNVPSTNVSQAISEFCGAESVSRTMANRRINDYIKEHGLKRPEDGRTFNADPVLSALLGVEEGTVLSYFKDLPSLMNQHFPSKKKQKAEAMEIDESSSA